MHDLLASDFVKTIIIVASNKKQNSQMGSLSSKTIRVATANYSGITFSPFEFYSDDSQELDQLNDIFFELFSQITPVRPQLHAPLAQLTNYNKLQDNGSGGKILSAKFDWSMNSIDKSMQRGRYCAQYRQDAGIENGRMVTMEKYFARWEFQFHKNVKYVKMEKPNRQKGERSIQQQQRICKVFDFLVYKTFMEYCYRQVFKQQGPGNSSNAQITIDDRDTDDSKETRTRRKHALMKYEQFQEKYHKKPYLKTDIKFGYIKELFTKHDVVFLQDCSDQLINQIKNQGDITIIEQLGGGSDCFILINSNSGGFHRLYDINRFMEEQSEQLEEHPQLASKLLFRRESIRYFESSPAVCLTDQFLMMSVHFSSRKNKKYRQIAIFMAHMLQIDREYKGKLKIIVGGDFNANIRKFTTEKDYLQEHQRDIQAHEKLLQQFWQKFHLYPQNMNEETVTTRKKRTRLQSQANKALKEDKSSRDFLISNCPLLKGRLISNHTNLTDNLPSAKHPFDHFFLSAEIAKE